MFSLLMLFALRGGVRCPGVARRLLTFFASPKKVSKERRPRRRCPFGVPVCARQKMGSGRNSLCSDTPTSFSIFCPAQTASAQWNTKHSLFGVRHIRFFNKAVAFDVPAFGVAKASDGQTGTTAQTCLSVALAQRVGLRRRLIIA